MARHANRLPNTFATPQSRPVGPHRLVPQLQLLRPSSLCNFCNCSLSKSCNPATLPAFCRAAARAGFHSGQAMLIWVRPSPSLSNCSFATPSFTSPIYSPALLFCSRPTRRPPSSFKIPSARIVLFPRTRPCLCPLRWLLQQLPRAWSASLTSLTRMSTSTSRSSSIRWVEHPVCTSPSVLVLTLGHSRGTRETGNLRQPDPHLRHGRSQWDREGSLTPCS